MESKINEINNMFCSKILTRNGDTEEYFLTIKREVVGNRVRLNYVLENSNEKVARVSIYHSFNDEEMQKKWHFFGYSEVPESMFEIDNLYVEPKFRSAGIGTAFINQIMKSINDFDKTQNLKSKIVLVRLNTPDAAAFFDKWNARENDEFFNLNNSSTRMIIDTPKVIPANNFVESKSPQEMQ